MKHIIFILNKNWFLTPYAVLQILNRIDEIDWDERFPGNRVAYSHHGGRKDKQIKHEKSSGNLQIRVGIWNINGRRKLLNKQEKAEQSVAKHDERRDYRNEMI